MHAAMRPCGSRCFCSFPWRRCACLPASCPIYLPSPRLPTRRRQQLERAGGRGFQALTLFAFEKKEENEKCGSFLPFIVLTNVLILYHAERSLINEFNCGLKNVFSLPFFWKASISCRLIIYPVLVSLGCIS